MKPLIAKGYDPLPFAGRIRRRRHYGRKGKGFGSWLKNAFGKVGKFVKNAWHSDVGKMARNAGAKAAQHYGTQLIEKHVKNPLLKNIANQGLDAGVNQIKAKGLKKKGRGRRRRLNGFKKRGRGMPLLNATYKQGGAIPNPIIF